jgi:hypothetical protein
MHLIRLETSYNNELYDIFFQIIFCGRGPCNALTKIL